MQERVKGAKGGYVKQGKRVKPSSRFLTALLIFLRGPVNLEAYLESSPPPALFPHPCAWYSSLTSPQT